MEFGYFIGQDTFGGVNFCRFYQKMGWVPVVSQNLVCQFVDFQRWWSRPKGFIRLF